MATDIPPPTRGLLGLAVVLRNVARLPGLKRLRRTSAVDRVADALYYGRCVEETFGFAIRELRARKTVGRYRPRGATCDVLVRHGTSDRFILGEVFGLRVYDFPPDALDALRRLGRPVRIVDLGAHVGMFGVHALSRLPDASIVSYEIDPANAEILERCRDQNALGGVWRIIRGSAGTSEGIDVLAGGLFAESHVDHERPGGLTVPRHDVFPDLAEADLIKIDIEGSEWPILLDPRFPALRPTLVALEYHPAQCPSPDPRAAAIDRFADLDYEVSEIPMPSAPPGVGMLWARRNVVAPS